MSDIRPLLAILVSMVAVGLILASDKKPNVREGWSIGAGIIKFLIVLSMAPTILSGQILEYTLYTFVPGLDIKFRVDPFGMVFATIASGLWIVTTFYSIGYMRGTNEKKQTRYFACFAISVASALGVAFSANLLTLFIFYEFLSLATFPLVNHKETPESFLGARKYLIYLVGASKTFLLAAIILTYSVAGTLEFSKGGLFAGKGAPWMLVLIYLFFIYGFAKAAIMPVHAWLPAAMVAPTPVSALLHAVAVVKVGVFSVLRVIFHVFGPELMGQLHLGVMTAYLVSFTIIMASIYALTRDNLKARLAYSTVSQLSYVILGAALLSPSGMTAGVIHIANHAISKITLFFCAGSIYVASHKTNISQMRGIGRKMPWTMTAFSIGALSMIGVPPVAGFVTKWYLALGAIEAGQIPILFVLIASTILNAGYFVPVIYTAFFHAPEGEAHGHGPALHPAPQSVGAMAAHDDHTLGHGAGTSHDEDFGEASPFVYVPLMVTAILSVLVGLFPDYFLALAKLVIQ
ncbi:monovalent cation/H+ antiporter subunit D family protein [Nitrospiraceae bacterium HYJII51-Mn-bac16s-1-B09]|uniref:Monovalent cation/H+ antiporter subunit D family protein n=2 Tax=Candidatus Manganitrophus noduliformans TaxID=2606439 RepID=A0A7X6DNW3_9BACT|nr:monovalent cation/H+ antiporter subunit D family protein [Candidatus Manganitrophus noduliformans]NKE70634.1 monovalent cation/H+ antiporter subunit D family protein [Candidatus Manganitrophus noduliformans]